MSPLEVAAWVLQAAPHPPHDGGFLPHGYCYMWNRPLLLTHLTSDVLIGASYVVISFALAALVHRARREIPFSVVFVAFGLFIITCGLTHFMEVWTLWKPVYWLSAYMKAVTAVASVSTAVAMPFMIPRVHATIRDARLSREREIAAARVEALVESNELLQQQALELELQREEAEKLARDLEESNARLRQAVSDAEAARVEAEEANRAKGEFLRTMSHELRTPLNAIGGYVDLLTLGVRGAVSDPQREDLERIRRSQKHLLGVISDILSFSRLESGKFPIHLRAVPLGETLDTAAQFVAPLLRAKGQQFAYEARADGVAVLADPDRLQQVLLNLLANAVKFTPEGGRISLRCEADGATVRVILSDDGPGIPPDKLEAVFEPFVQLERSLARPVEGTGLGLAISRELARAMGGDVTLVSAPGRGSIFTVHLPRA